MKEKQIEEMARFMCNCYDEGYCRMDGKLCDLECGSYKESEIFYEAGYRKQSEGEWMEVADYGVSKVVKCSCCENEFYFMKKGQLNIDKMPHCPKCGAKMKGE